MPRRRTSLALTFFALCCCASAAPPEVRIARDGKAELSVVVSSQASDRVRQASETLAGYLEKISGAPFEVVTGDGVTGIAVGLPPGFPKTPHSGKLRNPNTFQREHYLLQSHPRGLYVLGATDLAVEHAVWDLLYRIGYRQFFPGNNWEVIPRLRELAVAVDVEEEPDYHSRRIWYGFGAWDYAVEPYRQWCSRNRATSGVDLRTSHAYAGIIRSHRDEFKEHPEYLALVGGRREDRGESTKLCLGNSNVRRLVVKHAQSHFERYPDADSISVDPSDGGGWCECESCAKLGSVSDRALTLANEVASAVNGAGDYRLVGMYAYSQHSPPPVIRVHPRVVVSVATAFIRGGYTLDELIAGWSAKGATLGIREYYSVNTWDRDLPSRARGSNLDYLSATIPRFHAQGARYLSAESSDNWGPNGLGYYIASRILWDIDEAQRVPEIVDDFLTRAFGPARDPMADFYRLIDGSREHLLFDDLIGRMYRHLAEARELANSAAIRSRIDDLILYTRYVELYDHYANARGPARQDAFEAMIRHAYRIRQTMMIHAKAIYRDVASRDKSVTVPPDATWSAPESRNPWKTSTPFSESDLSRFVSEGIQNHPLVEPGFTPIDFSGDLVPAKPLELPEVAPGSAGRGRGVQVFYTYVDDAPSAISLQVTGGLIKHYRDRGNVKVDLWKVDNANADEDSSRKMAHDRSVRPDGVERPVRLTANEPGLYRITVSDGNDMTSVRWEAGTSLVIKSSIEQPMNVSGRWSLYFYVPKKTKIVGLFGGQSGGFFDGSGRKVYSLDGRKPGYHAIPVPSSQDGRLWKIDHAAGAVRLMTVPPHFARTGDELLLPREVVERDAKQ